MRTSPGVTLTTREHECAPGVPESRWQPLLPPCDCRHFLTGDGGELQVRPPLSARHWQPLSQQAPARPSYPLQAFLAGWGGLRVTRAGLRLLPPSLPLSVGALTLRNLSWRSSTLSLRITAGSAALSVSAGAPLCLVDAAGAAVPVLSGGPPVTLANATFAWPGLLVGVGEQGACQ